jgi:aspartate kinase
MPLVMKFGGGCLKNDKYIRKAAEIIISRAEKPAVVVSAIYGVTDLLLEGILKAKKNGRAIPRVVSALKNVHLKIIHETVLGRDIRKGAVCEIEKKTAKVEKLLRGISLTGEDPPSVRAHVLSYGERFAALVLAAVLCDRGADASPVESDALGLITDESYENASVLLGPFKKNFTRTARTLFAATTIPVITGFFGRTPEGKISLFGRNGSDYSAAVIAYGLEASVLEIWKDVDGFMSADPKLVPEARTIARLSYAEAAELSYFGAKILHPRTLEPLLETATSVRIKNLFAPQNPGTEIVPNGRRTHEVIKSVTINPDIALLRIHGPGVGYKPGVIGQIGRRLSDAAINIYSVITAQTCINLLVHKKDARRARRELSSLNGVVSRLDLEQDIVLVAAVGEGLLKSKGVAARIFSAVSRENINIEMISTGASEVASYFIVHKDDAENVVKAVHREFFGKPY